MHQLVSNSCFCFFCFQTEANKKRIPPSFDLLLTLPVIIKIPGDFFNCVMLNGTVFKLFQHDNILSVQVIGVIGIVGLLFVIVLIFEIRLKGR